MRELQEGAFTGEEKEEVVHGAPLGQVTGRGCTAENASLLHAYRLDFMAKFKSFLQVALRDFLHIGSIFPSSRFASRSIAKQLPPNCRVVVEYGAGNGRITKELLRQLPEEGRLYSIELNEDFIPQLKHIPDKRLSVIRGDVLEMAGRLHELAPGGVDAVVSGIPFSFLGVKQKREIVEKTSRALRSGGRFIVYQNSLKMKDILRYYFGPVHFFFEPRNVFPYFILVAIR